MLLVQDCKITILESYFIRNSNTLEHRAANRIINYLITFTFLSDYVYYQRIFTFMHSLAINKFHFPECNTISCKRET
jgi:hypothetical protein